MIECIHLVYPCSDKIRCPDAIGFNLHKELSKKYQVKVYDWESIGVIKPGKNEILIGHAHPNPSTIFRWSSKQSGWNKIICMHPFNHSLWQGGYTGLILHRADLFLAITGSYWYSRISKSILSRSISRHKHLDLAIERGNSPFVKTKFSEPGKRKFLYIGNDSRAKNLQLFYKLSEKIGIEKFGIIGFKTKKIKSYGVLNFQLKESMDIIEKYDFLIMTSKFDANPATILEAMAWGLIPICTKQSGYDLEDGIINIPLDNVASAASVLNAMDRIGDHVLKEIQIKNLQRLNEYYSWSRFNSAVLNSIEEEFIEKKYIKLKIFDRLIFTFFNIYSFCPRKFIEKIVLLFKGN